MKGKALKDEVKHVRKEAEEMRRDLRGSGLEVKRKYVKKKKTAKKKRRK